MTKGLATVLEVWRQETMFAKELKTMIGFSRHTGKKASSHGLAA
jgi:hypothetical protein